jgi:predicted nucleic acid-binding protein
VAAARSQGLEATGTLGVLERAAARGLIDLPMAVARLKATNFRYRPGLLDELMARLRKEGEGG